MARRHHRLLGTWPDHTYKDTYPGIQPAAHALLLDCVEFGPLGGPASSPPTGVSDQRVQMFKVLLDRQRVEDWTVRDIRAPPGTVGRDWPPESARCIWERLRDDYGRMRSPGGETAAAALRQEWAAFVDRAH